MPTLNEDEIRCLRFLAERFDRGGRSVYVMTPEIPGYKQRGERKTKDMLFRFDTHGFVKLHSTDSVIVRPDAAKYMEQLDATVSHVEKWKTLWLGRRWFAALVIGFIVLAAIAAAARYITDILSCFGIRIQSSGYPNR